MKKTDHYYVDNKKLYTAMVHYKTMVKESIQKGTPKPRVPEYVGECIYKIATKLSTSKNFVNYPFREDMIGDGIENCIMYIDNYDPDRYNNPFSYFTQVIYFAFLRRIKKEKKELYIKQKSLHNAYFFGLLEDGQMEDGSVSRIDLDNEYMQNLVEDFENKIAEKRAKNRKKSKNEVEDRSSE